MIIMFVLFSAALSAQTTTGNVTTLYNGYKSITTKWTGVVTKYKLIDESRGNGIQTIRHNDWFLFNNVNPVLNDNDNTWDDDYEKRIHGSSHWAAQRVWDYFVSAFGRSGPDENGKGLLIITDEPGSPDDVANLCAPATNPMEMQFKGPIAGECNPRISLNAMCHEFMHGVMFDDAGMSAAANMTSETKAILEGYCDVFGEFAEFDHQGWVDWKYDAESWINQTNMRAFHPPIFNGIDAMSYGDANWNASTDGHSRAGVLRHWVHLLSAGESGYCVNPIGIKKVENILYKVLNQGHLSISSTFTDLRYATVIVATSLYGSYSPEVAEIASAWYAVGVGGPFIGQINISNLTINAPTTNFSYNSKIVMQNNTVNNGGVLNVSSNTEIQVSPSFVSKLGSFTRLYIAPGCNGGARLLNPVNNSENNNEQPGFSGLNKGNEIKDGVILSPNPNNGIFIVMGENNNSKLISLDIQNSNGAIIKQMSGNGSRTEINIQDEPAGLYLVKLNYSDKIVTKKIIKQ
jgi:bacillolysin